MATSQKSEMSQEAQEPVRIETSGSETLLHMEGVVGVSQAKRLHQLALSLAEAGKAVSVRCEHLQHLDCASVQVLLGLSETLRSKGTGLSMVNLPDSVQQTLRTAGLASAF
jgi:anti-anti-sigma factor